jgi:SEC-C motif-containing protein
VGLLEGVHAPTPEALMRSRYSAYVLGLIDYLLATWHASTSPGELELPPLKWLALEVRHAEQSGEAGVVEFVARCRDGGRAQRLHEISRFVREAGRWYYIDGQMPDTDPG